MMRIGIMGGTYNPPHIGHMHAAQCAREALKLDALYLIPAGIPPHKKLPDGSATTEQRIEMTRLAARDVPGAQVLTIEAERAGASYTVDTLGELTAAQPDARFYLIMGTDMLLTFDTWRQPERIAQLCTLAVVARSERDRAAIAEKAQELKNTINAQIEIIRCEALPMSSTEIRASAENCARMTAPQVFAYIRENKLYF
ncbi:MAG: nicotinate (nicotinamide) nucleotide adenylyltransferase [Butyricicoccaceae bacterium]